MTSSLHQRIAWFILKTHSCLHRWACPARVFTHTQCCTAQLQNTKCRSAYNHRILCHEHEMLLKLNFLQLVEWRRSWGSILLSIYRSTAHRLKNKNAHQGEWCKMLEMSSMNPLLVYMIGKSFERMLSQPNWTIDRLHQSANGWFSVVRLNLRLAI